MINARASDDYLHSEVILSKISEYDIFKHYCPNFVNLGEKFCSDLRKDSTPSVSIVEWKSGLLYKDFGYPDHTFNCFSYVMFKYNIDFISCLETISRDFALNLAPQREVTRRAKIYSYTPRPKRKSIIKIKSRNWDKRDADYWKQYGISKDLLIQYQVIPIDYFWINEARFRVKKLGYAYRFRSGYKIYQPYETDDKWYSNIGTDVLQGYQQIAAHSDTLIITSSLKDVLVIRTLGYDAIAPQSEMVELKEEQVIELRKRFSNIVLLYDNDFTSEHNPGQRMAEKLCSRFGFHNLCIPTSYGSKDISDLVKHHGVGVAKQFINRELNEQGRQYTEEVRSDDGKPWN